MKENKGACEGSRRFSARAIRAMVGFAGALMIVIMGAQSAEAISIRHDVNVAEYNALGALYEAAGFISRSGFGQWCSSTQIAPDKVLTAAHCVDFNANGVPDFSPSTLMFGTDLNVPAFSSNVASIDVSPNWNGSPAFDLAVITLTEPITDITPARITDQNPNGLLATMVGYGRQGNGANHPSNVSGANDKLGAQNIIDWVTSTVRTDFDSPTGSHNTYGSADAVALEGTTAGGDSGGPVLAHFGDEALIVGVLNGGWNPYGWDSEYGDISEWAYIGTANNLAFLASHGVYPWTGFDEADFDEDGDVDGDDFLTWQASFANGSDGDADGDGDTDGDDFLVWQSQFKTTGGASIARVPEPSAGVAMTLSVCLGLILRQGRSRRRG